MRILTVRSLHVTSRDWNELNIEYATSLKSGVRVTLSPLSSTLKALIKLRNN